MPDTLTAPPGRPTRWPARLSISLSAEAHDAVEEIAKARSTSSVDCIREAVAEWLIRQRRYRRNLEG